MSHVKRLLEMAPQRNCETLSAFTQGVWNKENMTTLGADEVFGGLCGPGKNLVSIDHSLCANTNFDQCALQFTLWVHF